MDERGEVKLRKDLFALIMIFWFIVPRGLSYEYQHVGVPLDREDRGSMFLRKVGHTYVRIANLRFIFMDECNTGISERLVVLLCLLYQIIMDA